MEPVPKLILLHAWLFFPVTLLVGGTACGRMPRACPAHLAFTLRERCLYVLLFSNDKDGGSMQTKPCGDWCPNLKRRAKRCCAPCWKVVVAAPCGIGPSTGSNVLS